ncbi:hypothetical protein E4N62_27700 [Streptomyces sp. MNU76]|nr:hypothetical protein [Streptomyces sp. MNU76]MCC9708716.1 hypothetical protein [Streptomyces sp. MNU76]
MRAVVDDNTRPVGGGRMTTADPRRALYPRDTENQAVRASLVRNIGH